MEVHTSLQLLCASQEPGPGLQPLPSAQTLGHHIGTECDLHLTQSQNRERREKGPTIRRSHWTESRNRNHNKTKSSPPSVVHWQSVP